MILSCQHITKAFGEKEILKDINFHIEAREKTALVGVNGAGKSTLLKIIMEQLAPDDGQVLLSKGSSLGYLAQQQEESSSFTIIEALRDAKKEIYELKSKMQELEKKIPTLTGEEQEQALKEYANATHLFESRNGYAVESEILGVLNGLGFLKEDYDKPMDVLSGGQKTRVNLGKLLLTAPDIILLDEPTNHLDISSIRWLEGFLSNYKGAVLLVSHDRYFLDRIVTKVVDLDQGQARTYQGNYSTYATKKAEYRKQLMLAYLNQQRDIKHQEEVITKLKQFNREKSIKRAESREKLLDHMEVLDKPTEINAKMRIQLEPSTLSGEDVLMIEGLKKSFGSQTLFEDVDIDIHRGERVALIGKNGTGKTTLLKMVNKKLTSDSGKIRFGAKVKIGYYDQAQQLFNEENTIFEEISDTYEDLNNTKIRNTLASFLFTGDDVFKQIKELSGGERGRVSLAKLMLSLANFLLLDEPTNHLDIYSKEILEEALRNYTGTVFYVSHDRYFVNRTATRILELSDGRIKSYPGNYDDYLNEKEKEALREQETFEDGQTTIQAESLGKQDWKKAKEEQAKRRKLENDFKKVEEQIEQLEGTLSKLDETMSLPENATNQSKLLELSNAREETQEKLNLLYEQWEELSEEM